MRVLYVVFGSHYDYAEAMFADVIGRDDVTFVNERARFANRAARFVHTVHTSSKVNAKVPLPSQSVWFGRYIDESRLQSADQVIAIFMDSNMYRSNLAYLAYLKRRFNAFNVLLVLNTIGVEQHINIHRLKAGYDLVLTVDRPESEQYGITHIPGVYSAPSQVDNGAIETDVLFVGNNKGRLPQLLELSGIFHHVGIDHEFFVSKVPAAEAVPNDSVKYNQPLAYADVLQKSRQSTAVLEIVQHGQGALTLRTFEALSLGKILITNNAAVLNAPLFDERRVFLLDEVRADASRLVEALRADTDFPTDVADYSPERLLERLAAAAGIGA